MSFTNSWYNAEKTIILQVLTPPVSAEELNAAVRSLHELVGSVAHPVSVISFPHGRLQDYIVAGVLSVIQQEEAHIPPNAYMHVMVGGAASAGRSFLPLLRVNHPHFVARLRFANTLEQALALIESRQAFGGRG